MSIKTSIAMAESPYIGVHIYHESIVDSMDEMDPDEDVMIQIYLDRTQSTYRIPVEMWRILEQQIRNN